VAVRAWLASLEEVAFVAATSELPRPALVELLVDGLRAELALAGRLAGGQAGDRAAPVTADARA
jgi:hypothetical protein